MIRRTSSPVRLSHDICTPMNGIIGMTAIAAAHIDDKERVQDSLQKITAASAFYEARSQLTLLAFLIF